MKLTPFQESQREAYSENIITKLINNYKENVVEIKAIFASLKDRHSLSPF
jgi:hypothetical protein